MSKKMGETKKCKCCGRELPLSEFSHNSVGVFGACKGCVKNKKRESYAAVKKERDFDKELEDAKKMRLADFTPRDLMLRLKELGYGGYIDVPQVTYKRIDLSSEF